MTEPTEPIPSAPSPPSSGTQLAAWGWLEVIAAVALVLGLLIPEDDTSLWEVSEAWSVFALACALAQLAPLLRRAMGWTEERAWLVGVVGAAGVVLFWLLITLPAIARNTSFAVTVAAAAAAAGAWLAPGRHDPRS